MASNGEWWVNNTRDNLLKGVYDSKGVADPSNPPFLDDGTILRFLDTYPEAVVSFDRIFGSLLPEEQARLAPLRKRVRRQYDNVTWHDTLQNTWNRRGAHYAGKYAGRR